MKIVRFINDADEIRYGVLHSDERITYLDGDPLDTPVDTDRTATCVKMLAPLQPKSIVCIGLSVKKCRSRYVFFNRIKSFTVLVSIYNKIKADRFPPANSEYGCTKTWDSNDIKMYLKWRTKYPKNSKS